MLRVNFPAVRSGLTAVLTATRKLSTARQAIWRARLPGRGIPIPAHHDQVQLDGALDVAGYVAHGAILGDAGR